MSHIIPASKYFKVGGALRPNAPSYVQRPMDEELFKLLLTGQFCYILTARQMGKSSLMVRTADRLKKQGTSTAIIDLTQIGLVTIEQWYLGLLTRLQKQLRLSVDVESWWQKRAAYGPVHRFINFFGEAILSEIEGQIVIFVDEIDFTLKFDPADTDDFFAAIRAIYNARATEEELKRLTFVLLGVATPSELIKDRTRTPFNIGQGIALQEFSQSEAAVLRDGLRAVHPGQGEALFNRIYYWTNGHPYLTQKLCLAVAEEDGNVWPKWRVDWLVETLFLSAEARKETNLQTVRDGVMDSPNRRRTLAIYCDIYKGRKVFDDERSHEKNILKLAGLVKNEQGHLKVRNEIYHRVFDLEWIKANMGIDWTRRMAIIASLVTLALALTLGGMFWWQAEAPARRYEAHFISTTNSTLRLNDLAGLFTLPEYGSRVRALLGLPGYDGRARVLFDSLNVEEKIELFTSASLDLQPQMREVARGTYTHLEDTEANNRLLQTMQVVLDQSEEAESKVLVNEITLWLAGRTANTLEEKKSAYSDAIGWNDENSTLHFERALILIALSDNEGALTDFETILGLKEGKEWHGQVRQAIESNPQLYTTLWREPKAYPALVAVVPTPKPTPTPTSTLIRFLKEQQPTIEVPIVPALTPIPDIPDSLLRPVPTFSDFSDLRYISTPFYIPNIPDSLRRPIPTFSDFSNLRSIPTPIPDFSLPSEPIPNFNLPSEPQPNFSVPP